MKYRKKPEVIEAEQFFWGAKPWPIGVYKRQWDSPSRIPGETFPLEGYFIDTLEGPLHVSEGDWIITGVKGEQYPCKPGIFEATYEPVDSTLEKEGV